jgi:NAD(P)-dependent dehydrogenase (short-subunit alcohol dehydrogenase family)
MQLVVLTGASRGLGLALAEQLLARPNVLLTISRKPDPSLAQRATQSGARLEQWAGDVVDGALPARLEAWLAARAREPFERAVLINNAGILGRVGAIEKADAATLAAVFRVDLEAPAVLSAAFLRATRAWRAERHVVNVSSGAARVAIAGWAAYCAAKAGLDQLSRVMALDEARLPNPAKIVSIAPGIIDTEMQTELRASDAADFPDLARFKEFKATGQLATPRDAAARLLAFIDRANFGEMAVADVRTD